MPKLVRFRVGVRALARILLVAVVVPSLSAAGSPKKPVTKWRKAPPPAGYTLPKDCTSVFSSWCPWYRHKWGDVPHDSLVPLEQEKLDAISDCYIEQCEAAVAANPNFKTYLALGDALEFRGFWEEARDAYAKGLSVCHAKTLDGVMFHYRIAETWYAQGVPLKAIEELKKGIDIHVAKVPKGHQRWPDLCRNAYEYLTGHSFDYYRMPRDTGCKPFPEPQQAKYTENFGDCRKVSIAVKGIPEDDPRINFLRKKLKARGIACGSGSAGVRLSIRLEKLAPVDKPEGYALETGPRRADIRARDKQGVLWGIVSFLQLIDYDKMKIRYCSVLDWPDCPRRGYLGDAWAGSAEFTIFNKMNTVVHKHHPMSNGYGSPLHVYQCEQLAKDFHDLGLTLYYGIVSWTMHMGWPYCWKSYLGMQTEICTQFAEMGAGVYYPNDDCRYAPDVLRKEDLAGGKKPSDFDAQHILDLFTAVKDGHPEFKMVYCPPFYWGPNAKHPYPDDREKYLRSLRIFPEEIGVIWTGDRVKSYKKEPYMVKWFTNLTGRKPYLFQNGTGPHNRLSYVVDRTDWNGWHYPGFFENDIACYLKNAHTPTECPQITSLADCLWNVKAYEPDRAIRRGIGNFAGDAFFNALDGALKDLCYIDRYEYGQLTSSVRDEDVAELEEKLGRIEKATADAAAFNGMEFLASCGAWTQAVGWYRNLVNTAKNPPDYKALYREQLAHTEEVALASGYNRRNGDILLDAIDLHHSEAVPYPPTPRGRPAPKDQMLTCGIWGGGYADAKFKVGALPRAGGAEIVLRGRSDLYVNGPKPEKRMVIELNGKRVFEGKTPFGTKCYQNQTFKVPLSAFKANAENELKIVNGKDDCRLMVVFALIKFPRGKKGVVGSLEDSSISLDE